MSETLDPDNINIKKDVDILGQSWWHRVIGCPPIAGAWGHGQNQATRVFGCGDQTSGHVICLVHREIVKAGGLGEVSLFLL
ncbi:hypothetical protein OIU74_004177 [Salix koriyanagi]|uniref:Uncharacterized protein n=1 Tax=Salix koriyanagi TaxID=2511006 RepID=A0A9Q0V0A8_9ROSI|nr:hypothetical protein OIU74_004177 [Salix koriyanagi]